MKRAAGKPKILSSNLFPVVGIGASAGGLEAFKKLLKAIPEDSGMAYVLVQHLDPNHESLLAEILQKITPIPVLEISDDIKVQPNHIYVIPSNKMMVATDGVLQLEPRPAKSSTERNMPIDLFFNSLAAVHQAHAIGVVLSGTATDGTLGLKAIKDHGGVTFAQDEASAAYDGMPNSAVQAGVVDFILPPEEIPQKLLEITRITNPALVTNEFLLLADEEVFKQILALIRIRKGTDFTYYKQTTIRRRILRRMAINKNEKPSQYLDYLRENKQEQDVLYQDLLIPVTGFFRDEKIFENLCETVFPAIIKNKTAGETIRVWVAGCSTGEEAYSIAICIKEFLTDYPAKNMLTGPPFLIGVDKVQVFATDISEPAITKARSGRYSKIELANMSAQRLSAFFTKSEDRYQVNKQIRDMCVFATHNFLKDPPFGKIDFISCRNVFIYMEPYLQKKALNTFHYALNENGFLLMGKSETTGVVTDLFSSAGKNDRLFSRKNVASRFMQTNSMSNEKSFVALNSRPGNEIWRTDFQKTADDIILNRYTPAGVVVNEAMDIVHFRGSTGKYLEQPPGKPNINLMKMARDGLAFELRNILHKAKKENAAVIKENIPLEINGCPEKISIEAMPLPNIIEPHYLILFHDNMAIPGAKQALARAKGAAKRSTGDKDLRIQQLEQELAQAREDMRSITDEQEAANGELQGVNEELLSSSEELQSLNEEMETSKEELQSTNEELMAVNHEMISLNEQVTIARDYAEGIVSNTREPLLVLDRNLRVKTANKAFYKTFRLNEQETEGVLIYDLANKQWDIPGIRILLEEKLPENTVVEDFELVHTFLSAGQMILLLNAREVVNKLSSEKLVLLAIEDITERKRFQAYEKELLTRFQNLVMQAPVAILVLKGPEYFVELANDFYLQIIGKDAGIIGKPFFDVVPSLGEQGMHELLENVMDSGMPLYGNERAFTVARNNTKERCFFNFVYQPVMDHEKKVTGIIVVVNEVTEQVIARKRMEAQANMVQDLLMTAPGFICTLTGPDHVYGLVNDRYQQLFGKRKIRGKKIMDALPELAGQGFDTLLDKVYNTGEPYVGIEVPIVIGREENKTPETGYFNFSYQPMFDDSNKIYSILVFGYEVTAQVLAKNKILEITQTHESELQEKITISTQELKQANESLLQKNYELLQVNKDLESFNYVSSHDLQEPLRKIQTFISRILEKEYLGLSEKGKEYFNKIKEAGVRMQALIEDLLVYSHTNIGEWTFEPESLATIISGVTMDLAESIQEKNATVDCGHLDTVSVNLLQFRQLFQNLIANALKFSKEGVPPHIDITSEIATGGYFGNKQLIAGKKYCCIRFRDNGIGFDPQYKDQIFEVFQRLHEREAYAGTGIGLAIVKKIVEKHQGIITADSAPGMGATFTIYLPV